MDASEFDRQFVAHAPAHQVVAPGVLHVQLDAPLAAAFEYPLVGHPVVVAGQIGVGRGGHRAAYARTLAQRADRLVPHRLVHLAQFGLGFGLVQQNFGVAEHRERVGAGGVALVRIVVGVPLDDAVVGQLRGQAGEDLCEFVGLLAADLLDVVGRDEGLAQAVVAAGELVLELRLVVSVLVREARPVEVQVHVDERFGTRVALSVAARGVVPRGVVKPVERGVELVGQDHFGVLRLLALEDLAVIGRLLAGRRDQRIGAVAHQLLRGGDARAEPFLAAVQPVVLPPGSLVEADARFQGQRHIAVDDVGVDVFAGLGAPGGGEVEVFEDLLHDVVARVAALVELFVVVGVDRLVVPGHVAEGLDLVPVEPRAPEAADALVMLHRRVVHIGGRVLHVLEVIVDVVERTPVAPRPVVGLLGAVTARLEESFGLGRDADVAVLVAARERRGRGQVAFEKADRIGFQRRFRIEKGVGGRRIDGVFVEEALARGQEGQSGDYRYLVQYGFHGIAC